MVLRFWMRTHCPQFDSVKIGGRDCGESMVFDDNYACVCVDIKCVFNLNWSDVYSIEAVRITELKVLQAQMCIQRSRWHKSNMNA